MYKARYYPQGNFLTAKMGGSPSFVRRSVMEARELIKQGIACRVGNGESISILNDPWFSDVNNPYINSVNEALQGQKLLTGENRWDVDLLDDIFVARDVNLMLYIPLREHEMMYGTGERRSWVITRLKHRMC